MTIQAACFHIAWRVLMRSPRRMMSRWRSSLGDCFVDLALNRAGGYFQPLFLIGLL